MGSASLSRNPDRPGADRLEDVLVEVERGQHDDVHIGEVRVVDDLTRVAARPSSSGMRMSMTTTSGSSRRTSSIASPPFSASPTTSRSSSASRRTRKPGSKQRLVVGQDDPGHPFPPWRGSYGRWAWTRNPPPGLDPAARVPPTVVARSRIPIEPVPTVRRRGGGAEAVVDDLYVDSVATVGDGDRCRGVLSGMPHDVGQGLLHDAVGGHVDGSRESSGVTDQAQLHRQPGLARHVHQRAEPVEPWRRCQRCRLVVIGTEDVERGAELTERLFAQLLDGGQGGLGLLGLAGEHVQSDARLQVDSGDAVGDDVVQVACDAQALLGDSATGFFVAALLEIMGPLLELGEIGPPVVLRGPEEYRPGDPSGERQQQRQVLGTIVGERGPSPGRRPPPPTPR